MTTNLLPAARPLLAAHLRPPLSKTTPKPHPMTTASLQSPRPPALMTTAAPSPVPLQSPSLKWWYPQLPRRRRSRSPSQIPFRLALLPFLPPLRRPCLRLRLPRAVAGRPGHRPHSRPRPAPRLRRLPRTPPSTITPRSKVRLRRVASRMHLLMK